MTAIHLPGFIDPNAAATVRRFGHTPEAAALQAEAVFAQLHATLAAAGGTKFDVCKITMQITDRAYRQAIYAVLGRELADVFPVSTGLIVNGLPDPDALFQLQAWAVAGGPHTRLRKYRSTDAPYGLNRQQFVCDFCMVVVAGSRIFLRGQTGLGLDGKMVGINDPAAQASMAIENVKTLLADAGADLSHAVKLVTYVTDRAFLEPVRRAVLPHFDGDPIPSNELVIKGLAAPEVLMEIDVHAIK